MATAHVCGSAADTFPPAQRGVVWSGEERGEVAEEEGGPNATPTLDYTGWVFPLSLPTMPNDRFRTRVQLPLPLTVPNVRKDTLKQR